MTHDPLSQLRAKCQFDQDAAKAFAKLCEISISNSVPKPDDTALVAGYFGRISGAQWQSDKDRAIMDALREIVQMQAKTMDTVLKSTLPRDGNAFIIGHIHVLFAGTKAAVDAKLKVLIG